jgi:hypothetical protein
MRIRDSLNLNEVHFGMLEFRVSKPVGQLAIVGQQDQAFAVAIESARRVDARNFDIVSKGGPALSVAELAENVIRLVKSETSQSVRRNALLRPSHHAIPIVSLKRSRSH